MPTVLLLSPRTSVFASPIPQQNNPQITRAATFGFAAVLLDHAPLFPEDAAEAGHAALNETFAAALGNALKTIGVDAAMKPVKTQLDSTDTDYIANQVTDAVTAAIKQKLAQIQAGLLFGFLPVWAVVNAGIEPLDAAVGNLSMYWTDDEFNPNVPSWTLRYASPFTSDKVATEYSIEYDVTVAWTLSQTLAANLPMAPLFPSSDTTSQSSSGLASPLHELNRPPLLPSWAPELSSQAPRGPAEARQRVTSRGGIGDLPVRPGAIAPRTSPPRRKP
jgi:hypothetical protein